MGGYARRARLTSGLVIAAFVITHFINHIAAIQSLDAAETWRESIASIWHFWPAKVALYLSFAIHFLCALHSLYRRHSLRMPAWEATQVMLGLAVIPLIALHIVSTRGVTEVFGIEAHYGRVAAAIWSRDLGAARQFTLIVVVWLHLCYGIHFWLRMKSWYPPWQPLLLALAVLMPALVITGLLRTGAQLAALEPAVIQLWFADLGVPMQAAVRFMQEGERAVLAVFFGALGAVAVARAWRGRRARSTSSLRLELSDGRRVHATSGATVLDGLRAAGIAHASVCGGRGRCTTCRIRVIRGAEHLPLPDALEREALARIDAPPNVRLACQARPAGTLTFAALLPPSTSVAAVRQPGGVSGQESVVTAMFLDLRGSTRLGERKLPYDVLFILNQFFAEMSAALDQTHGHYAQFAGDGLMALYGLRQTPSAGARAALQGAALMLERMQGLNQRLADELEAPLRIGIGIHAGEAIVGTMGPPASPNHSAIGDNINIAARLEARSKSLGQPVVVSVATLELAGAVVDPAKRHTVEVRGREAGMEVCTFAAAGEVRAALAAG
ncbi:MAG: 2Fe-2S iron-sulfur cluster binding domain-containing protein [Gammaproteobacteria bacterium]|nr:2Fe-2S iron-sulfur cluster binding domain-containing protein [Gammaproteobacteria bacterium]